MKHQTTLLQRLNKRMHKAELRVKGICLQCEKRPVTTNTDGTTSVRCVECRDQMTARKMRYKSPDAPVRRVVVEVEPFFDTQAGQDYEALVLGIVDIAKTWIGTREIKACCPSPHHERWLWETLGRLESVGVIESRQLGGRQGYRKSIPHRPKFEIDAAKLQEWKQHKAFQSQCYPTSEMVRAIR